MPTALRVPGRPFQAFRMRLKKPCVNPIQSCAQTSSSIARGAYETPRHDFLALHITPRRPSCNISLGSVPKISLEIPSRGTPSHEAPTSSTLPAPSGGRSRRAAGRPHAPPPRLTPAKGPWSRLPRRGVDRDSFKGFRLEGC